MNITSTHNEFGSMHMRTSQMEHLIQTARQRAERRDVAREHNTKIGVVVLMILLLALAIVWALIQPPHAVVPQQEQLEFLNTICSSAH